MVSKIITKFKNIFSYLLIITIIEYTVFSVRISNFYAFIVILLMGTAFYFFDSKKSTKIGILYSLIIAFLSFYISFDISITDNLYYFVYNYLKIHLFALAVCYGFKKALNFKTALCGIFSVSIFISVLELAKFKYIDNISFSKELSGAIEQYIEMYISTIKTTGLNIDFDQLSEMLFKSKELLLIMYPSLLMIGCFIESFIIYFFSRIIIGLFCKKRFDNEHKFRNFYIGKGLSFIVLILLIASPKGSMFENCVYNFTLIAAFLYFLNGFAVVSYLFNKFIKKDYLLYLCLVFVLFLSVITILILPTVNGISIMFIMGLTDATFDYRKIRRKEFLIKK